MTVKGWAGNILFLLALGLFILLAACGPGKAATQTAIAQTQVQQTAEEATRIAPTYTPTPTKTPIPTETPVPTPTTMKISTQDGVEDCEVVTGILGEEGCQVDVKMFEMLPCENPGMYTFEVAFYRIVEPLTTNICFLINGDGLKETGLEDEGFFGIEWDYCWMPETEKVVVTVFDGLGEQVETLIISDPLGYVSVDEEGLAHMDPFWMTFPPTEFGELELPANAEAIVQVMFYNTKGDMVLDSTQPILLSACPTSE
jgi:hypothetical protein